jgi:hypothetical protein
VRALISPCMGRALTVPPKNNRLGQQLRGKRLRAKGA